MFFEFLHAIPGITTNKKHLNLLHLLLQLLPISINLPQIVPNPLAKPPPKTILINIALINNINFINNNSHLQLLGNHSLE